MPEPDPQRVKDLFLDAQDLPAGQRETFLDRACGADAALRAEVEALLGAHAAADQFMERPPTWAAEATRPPGEERESPGQEVGPFVLIERVGEGGFGTVWRAEQRAPVQRLVALKIVKLGMDTVQVVRRFEQERSALARMDHPNVAKVFDGGVTEDGRPWFAMEFVEGDPIHHYCDRHRLNTRARVRVLIDVCRAVQHAHHKGIVHRDIKPSNVLVGDGDKGPMPRVIDFGIAKAMEGDSAEASLMTAQGGLLGTPEYMSPEQVQTGSDVDARTDVYSLGALIYEVLTGARPFNFSGPGRDNVDVLLRRIQSEDPARPSTLVGGLPEAAGRELLAARRSNRRELRRQLRGDLDWITLRAMEKDPRRRYATADQLAGDLERFLRDEPVQAGPPSLFYRLGKLGRRHRAALVLSGLALVSLVGGSSFAWYGFLQARAAERKEREAREQAVQRAEDARNEALKARLALAKLEELLFSADPRAAHAADYSAREMLEDFAARLAAQPLADRQVEARIHHSLGITFMQLAALDLAERHLRAALSIRARELGVKQRQTLETRRALAVLLADQSHHEEAIQRLQAVVADLASLPDGRAVRLQRAAALEALAAVQLVAEQFEAGLEHVAEALRICTELVGAEHIDTARCRATQARLRMRLGRHEGLEETLLAVGRVLARHLPAQHPDISSNAQSLAVYYDRSGRPDLALPQYRLALAGRLAVHGELHPLAANTRMSIGWALVVLGRLDEALPELQRATESFAAILPPGHPGLARAQLRYGECLSRMGSHDEALRQLRAAVRGLDDDGDTVVESHLAAQSNLTLALQRAGKRMECIAAGRRCAELLGRAHQLPDTVLVHVEANAGRALFRVGEHQLAHELLQRAHARAQRLWPAGHEIRVMVAGFLAEADEALKR